MEAKEMRMNCKVMAALAAVVGLSLSASAANKTFSGAGGDLADEAGWGGALPVSGDKVFIDKAGTYTLSKDLTLPQMQVTAGGCLFSFGDNTLTLSGDAWWFFVKAADSRTVFDGGTLDFVDKTHCQPARADGMTSVFTNGCVVTNTTTFYGARGASNVKTEIAGGAKVYAQQLVVTEGGGSGNIVEIYDGGQLYVANRIYSDSNTPVVDAYAGNVLRVRGSGSLFKYTGPNDAALGFQTACNTFHIVDGGDMDFSGSSGSLLLGGWSYSAGRTNNALVVERSATANLPKILSNCDHNRIFVGSGATLTTAKLRLSSSMNEVVVSNATLTCTAPRNSTTASQEGFNLATSATSTGNVFRLIGPSASLGTLPWPLYWFNSSSYITFSIEGGAKWGDADTHFDALFSKEQHCTFRVTGAGTVFGDAEGKSNRLYLCNKNAAVTETCASNVVEVSDGATLYASGIYMAGVGNALVVSNGTVNVKYLSIGHLTNDKTDDTSVATNCMVRLCGTSPKISISGGSSFRYKKNSVLRFEIPRAGYAANHVPVEMSCGMEFDDTCRLEIDCEEFAQKGGATFTLIQTGSDITETERNNLLASVNTLPSGCTLNISDRTVKLRCPRRGFIVSFR